MALQDLTPQLRTRLSRMERAVGWFVLIAMGVLLFGFGYYIYSTAERKGWFKTKAPYYTYADRATGLHVGDPVQLMGFAVGQITRIDAMPPGEFKNVYVEFEIKSPYDGYIWTEGSMAKVTTADLLGKRVLEVTKGTNGYPTYVFNPLKTVTIAEARALPALPKWQLGEEFLHADTTEVLAKALAPLSPSLLDALAAAGYTNLVVLDGREKHKAITGVWLDGPGKYAPLVRVDTATQQKNIYPLLPEESPAVTERLEQLVRQVEQALPGVLNLTNRLAEVLSNSASMTANLNQVALQAQPAVSNLALATARLDREGGLGEWLLPTNINQKLDTSLGQLSRTLGSAESTLDTANTNISALALELSRSLENLANITSNLNSQVEANTNILSAISKTVTDTDQFVQGLKRHWLLRSAFKEKRPPASSGSTPAPPVKPLRSPKEKRG